MIKLNKEKKGIENFEIFKYAFYAYQHIITIFNKELNFTLNCLLFYIIKCVFGF